MIGFIRGKLIAKAPPQLLLDVHGVGYEVEAPMTTFYDLPTLGEDLLLFTHLVIREDAHILFAFSTEADRMMFRALIKVNGVGPKLALTILSGQNAEEFCYCIHNNDVQALVSLPGVGKKTAERLIIEMRDRLPPMLASVSSNQEMPANNQLLKPHPKQEAISALCALGYKPQVASHMVESISPNDKSCEEIIKLALQVAVRK